jgi:hypothetical protein
MTFRKIRPQIWRDVDHGDLKSLTELERDRGTRDESSSTWSHSDETCWPLAVLPRAWGGVVS